VRRNTIVRRLTLLAIAVGAVAPLVSCGDEEKRTATPPPATPPPTAPPTPAPPSAVSQLGDLVRDAQTRTASVHLSTFRLAIAQFVVERGRLPASIAEMAQPDPKTGVPTLEKVPADPWGHPYEYRVKDEAKRDWVVRSAGPDGRLDTADDVVGTP